MNVDQFDYELPEQAIAQQPVEPRDAARLLDATGGDVAHRHVHELAELVEPGDVIVVNDTKVMAARLLLHKSTGGAAEVLLLEQTPVPGQWEALVRPGRRLPPGTALFLDGQPLVEVGEILGDGRRVVTVAEGAVEAAGQIPLPPYIHDELSDTDRYQTVFARNPTSVAAPTAGLHLTKDLIARLEQAGARLLTVELQVGLGTFRPITADRVEDHAMHTERYAVTADTWQAIQNAGRVLAVGTTVVRTLESVAVTSELSGATDLFIRRGFDWQVVDLLLTNFHVPRSSLLVLVDALIGGRWRELYKTALGDGYRFLSFGDCMLLEGDHYRARIDK